MLCLYCRKQIEPVDHNDRGPRCPVCWERVIVEEEAPKVKVSSKAKATTTKESTKKTRT